MPQHGWKIATLVAIPVGFILGWFASRWTFPENIQVSEIPILPSRVLPTPILSQPMETDREVIEVIDLAQVFEPRPLPREITHDPLSSSTSPSIARAFHEELIELAPPPRIVQSEKRNCATGEEESDLPNLQSIPWYLSLWAELMNRMMPLKGSTIPDGD
jgi:hypothetical protein